MAIDEAIFLESMKNKQTPTLRFYGWEKPAVSLGYFQNIQHEINDAECRTAGVDVVRRLTGGKAVFHNDEITYSISAGNREKYFPDDILGTYKVISQCLAAGLAHLGIKACLADTDQPAKNAGLKSCCFSVPSGNELLVAGRKICGSAQTRIKKCFLQHGSLLLTFDPLKTAQLILPSFSSEQLALLRQSVTAVNEEIPAPLDPQSICVELQKGFRDVFGVEIEEGCMTPAEEALSRQLIIKYAEESWNRLSRIARALVRTSSMRRRKTSTGLRTR